MFAKNKKIVLGALAAVTVWAILYGYVLVQPNWNAREASVRDAQTTLDTWLKFYKKKEGHIPLPDAAAQLVKREQVLDTASKELKQIEFASDWQGFTLAAAGSSDPNNYFDRKRGEVLAQAKTDGLRFAPGLDDLGFRAKVLTEEPVPLNLVRLFALSRLLAVTKTSRILDIQKIEYPKHRLVPADGEGAPAIERLYVVPLEVRFRATERDFAQFLFELQRPSDGKQSYFALRAFRIEVKDQASGMTECWVAAGALVPEGQAKNLKIELKEDERSGGPPKPNVDVGRY